MLSRQTLGAYTAGTIQANGVEYHFLTLPLLAQSLCDVQSQLNAEYLTSL